MTDTTIKREIEQTLEQARAVRMQTGKRWQAPTSALIQRVRRKARRRKLEKAGRKAARR